MICVGNETSKEDDNSFLRNQYSSVYISKRKIEFPIIKQVAQLLVE